MKTVNLHSTRLINRQLLFSLLVCLAFYGLPSVVLAQFKFELEGIVQKKISDSKNSTIPVGAKVKLTRIDQKTTTSYATLLVGKEVHVIYSNDIEKIKLSTNTTKEYWQSLGLKNGIYDDLGDDGPQYQLRLEMEEEILRYLSFLHSSNLIYHDSYLLDYLYSLVYKILPGSINDGRTGTLNISVIKDNAPFAFMFSNGSMLISAGLLSTLNSEDELIAILSNEIAHFVLDHSVKNVASNTNREKTKEFWAAMDKDLSNEMTSYLASNNEYYSPGVLMMNSAPLSNSVMNSVKDRLGIRYTKDQEMLADQCASELMTFIKINPVALSSAFKKIENYCTISGYYNVISENGYYHYMEERAEKIGPPIEFQSTEYDKKVSFVNTQNAIIEFNKAHIDACNYLVNRNINAKVATEEDYILSAMTTLRLYDNEYQNNEALTLLKKARTLNVYPSINVYKQEAIVLIRLNRKTEAIASLEEYSKKLSEEIRKTSEIRNERIWSIFNAYFKEEYEWTMKMINKTKFL